ncbi:EamA family transporter [Amylibacter sp.]|nr:EamA family transporter [Amylibacter sp.]
MNANFKSITKYDFLIILYLAIFASAATFLLIQYAALKLPSVKVMAHTYLTPTWVIFWYIFMGKDGPLASDYIGISFTIIALFLLLKEQTGN